MAFMVESLIDPSKCYDTVTTWPRADFDYQAKGHGKTEAEWIQHFKEILSMSDGVLGNLTYGEKCASIGFTQRLKNEDPIYSYDDKSTMYREVWVKPTIVILL